MTEEQIKAYAEEIKKAKYCKMYLRDSTKKPYLCDLDCPFNYDGMNCEDEYETAFADGFNEAFAIFERVHIAQLEMLVDKIKNEVKI